MKDFLQPGVFKGVLEMKNSVWKSIDVIAYSLLLIGALNWGLVGLFGFDLVAAMFG